MWRRRTPGAPRWAPARPPAGASEAQAGPLEAGLVARQRHVQVCPPCLAPPTPAASQVYISSRGVLRVTHMLMLASGPAAPPPLEAQPLLGTFSSQGGPQRMCVVQFVVLPHDDADAGEPEDAAGF